MLQSLARGGWVVIFGALTVLADGVPSIVFQKPLINALYRFTTDPSGRVIGVGSAAGCIPVTNGSFNSSFEFSISLDRGATWSPQSNLLCDQTEPQIVAIAPADPPILYAATYTSILKSADNGRTWALTAPVPLGASCSPDVAFLF